MSAFHGRAESGITGCPYYSIALSFLSRKKPDKENRNNAAERGKGLPRRETQNAPDTRVDIGGALLCLRIVPGRRLCQIRDAYAVSAAGYDILVDGQRKP